MVPGNSHCLELLNSPVLLYPCFSVFIRGKNSSHPASWSAWYFTAVSTSFFEPRQTGTRWCREMGWTSSRRWRPVLAPPPACSTRKLIGLASYIRRSLPPLGAHLLSSG